MRFNETGKNKELFELLNVMKEKYAKGKAKIDGVSEVIDFEEIRQMDFFEINVEKISNFR